MDFLKIVLIVSSLFFEHIISFSSFSEKKTAVDKRKKMKFLIMVFFLLSK